LCRSAIDQHLKTDRAANVDLALAID
jgi:hypothetical protein